MNIGQEIKILIKPTKIFFPKGLNNTLEEGGFAIFVAEVVDKLKSNYEDYNIKLKGNSCSLSPKFNYITTCVLKDKHETYGNTFEILSIRADVKLEEMSDVEDFLTSIIGEKRAKSLVEAYPDTLLSILENSDIDKLCQVKGIKIASAKKILSKYEETKDYSLLIAKTKQMGLDLTIKTVKKLLKIFGNEEKILKMLRENPYDLSKYVDGYGFKKCDTIAIKSGLDPYSPIRISSAIVHVLNKSGQNGIEILEYTELLKQLYDLIGFVPQDNLNIACKNLIDENKIKLLENGNKIVSAKYYNLEKKVYNELIRIATTKNTEIESKINSIDIEEELKNSESILGFKLTEEQELAIRNCLSNTNISVLTANAGGGKSSISKLIFKILDSKKLELGLSAPTGKASLRVTEATGFPASTIHRLLRFNPMFGFEYNSNNKLPYDVIAVDESGMLDLELFYSLLQSIKDGARLILIGDTRQLVSIGSGNILSDILNANVDYISKTRLTKVKRQQEDSGLMQYIQTVLDENKLFNANYTGKKSFGVNNDAVVDIFLESGSYVLNWVAKEYMESLKLYNNDIFSTVVIGATRVRGELSLYNINNKIQELVKPIDLSKPYFEKLLGKTEEGVMKYIIQVGDKVILTKNLYNIVTVDEEQTNVYNGNSGIVTNITPNTVSVKFDTGDEVILSRDKDENEAEALLLGYAITCHSSQGSEFKSGIVVLDNGAYILGTNEWLYTAITRPKERLRVYAQNYIYRKCIETREQISKRTLLVEFLNKTIE